MNLSDELAGADFGDRRLTRRLGLISQQMAASPGDSFPHASGGGAELEGTYRFLNNEAVSAEQILAPHFRATAARARAEPEVVVTHDTTEFSFPSTCKEMGWLDRKRSGFFAHVTLAVSTRASRMPLGVLGLKTIFRYGKPDDRKQRRKRRHNPNSEERRWAEGVDEAERRLGAYRGAIHVMDCEADSFSLFAELVRAGRRFVIRMAHNRLVGHSKQTATKVEEVLSSAPVYLEREVALAKRGVVRGHHKRRHPLREARVAKLSVSAQRVTFLRPDWAPPDLPRTIEVNVVRVFEASPPQGVEPIEWMLVTTEPIQSAEDLGRIVDAYRIRWVVEEFFKAIKTGCAFERRKLESRRAIVNALAVFIPISWQLLLLRSISRRGPRQPAHRVLSALQIMLLHRHEKLALRAGANAREAMWAIAKLGGHIKSNGDPGWIVLGRGFEKLLLLEEGARLALKM